MTTIENIPIVHAPDELIPSWFRKERTRTLTSNTQVGDHGSSVCYWMQRDVRVRDNWAYLWASHLAKELKLSFHVVYALPPAPTSSDDDLPDLEHLPMTARHASFLLGGLEHVHKELKDLQVPLHVLMPSDASVGVSVGEKLTEELDARLVVSDFTPIRHYRQWNELQAAPLFEKKNVTFYQVDAHNCVPVWEAADKRQVGARTLRPRLHKQLPYYLPAFPKSTAMDQSDVMLPAFDRPAYEKFLQADGSVSKVEAFEPGYEAGMRQFDHFVRLGLKSFDKLRNDPTQKHIISNLSPWINHGHVSFARLAIEIKKLNKYAEGSAAFIEEGIVRRELSDNFLYYTPNDYDALTAAAGWAQDTLQAHASDPREYVYSLEELEKGETHEDIWNAAQMQLVAEGKLHGFMRMYWCKKILEWTESPEIALKTAQYFNDKYALDGRDPNGFTGVGWSIMGIHDMGWKERDIFGKIRFMNYAGCKRKFKVKDFVAMYKGAAENAVRAETKHAIRKRTSSSKFFAAAKKQKT